MCDGGMLELPGRYETLSMTFFFILFIFHDGLAGCFFCFVVIKADIFLIVPTSSLCILYSGISLKTSGLGHNAASKLVKKKKSRHSNMNDCCWVVFFVVILHHFINRKIRIPASYKQEFEAMVAWMLQHEVS